MANRFKQPVDFRYQNITFSNIEPSGISVDNKIVSLISGLPLGIKIPKGNYTFMSKVSLKDIANAAGVSPSTVSFVLNDKSRQMRISDDVSDRIKLLAQKMGYHPNQVAVSLRTGKSKIIGLVVESISGRFFAELARIIDEEAQSEGYRIIYCSTENNALRGTDMVRMLSQRQVDGYLITPVPGMEEVIGELMADHRPLVFVDSYVPQLKIPYVLVDNAAGVKEGMLRLIRKGYQRIGYVTPDLNLVQLQQREEAYRKTLTENKRAFRRKYVLKLPYTLRNEEATQAIKEFIAQHKELDALFFATNYFGIAGLESIRQLGLQIPDDMAVVCFDDDYLFRFYPPGISSIEQPVEDIARNSIRLLMEQIRGEKVQLKSAQRMLKPRFISRHSL